MRVDDETVTRRVLDRRTYLRATGLTAVGAGDSTTEADIVMPETILIEADGNVSFRFDVSGDVIPVPGPGDVRDTIGNEAVFGVVADGIAAYHVTGEVSGVRIDGDGRVEYGQDAREGLSDPPHVIAIRAPPETSYELTASGPVEPLDPTHGTTVRANDDETWTATARGSRSFAFEGQVTALDANGRLAAVEIDGRNRYPWELTGVAPPRRQDVLVTAPTDLHYEFTATDGIERTTAGSGARPTDDATTVTRNDDGTWTATGTVADGFCETFTVYGTVTAFTPERGDFSLLVGGDPHSPRALLGTDADSPDTTPLGGGEGYRDSISPTDATITVSTASDLTAALADAAAGDTVFLEGDADIEVGTSELRVPEGVTLASDRGTDAAPGGRLATTDGTWPMLTVESDARVTGLRLDGPQDTFVAYDSDRVGLGLDVVGSGVEIDNCELSGFASAAIRCGGDTHVHHSYLHHLPMAEVGTAVRCTDGHPVIEDNYINYARHGVTATGTGGFTVAYNQFGTAITDATLVVDSPGGTVLDVHHNTVSAAPDDGAGEPPVLTIDGTPDGGATVANNWFETDALSDGHGGTVVRTTTGERRTIAVLDNHYGSDEPARSLGHPR